MTDTENLLKENGLYDKLLAVFEKYNIEDQKEVLSKKSDLPESTSKSVSTYFFVNHAIGDIFLCYGGSSRDAGSILGMLIPGHWKHAGIKDLGGVAWGQNKTILSASNATTHGFEVGYETHEKWSGESAVTAVRVNGRTESNAKAAVLYGRQFLGRGFNFGASRTSNDNWYCSKLVYRCWLSQGKTLEPSPMPWNPWVTPNDLWDDNDTYRIGGDAW